MLCGNTKNKLFDTKLTCIFYTNHFRIFCIKRYKFVVNLQGIKTLKNNSISICFIYFTNSA